jgi:SAM-dependent methyltransferase
MPPHLLSAPRSRWLAAAAVGAVGAGAAMYLSDKAPYPYAQHVLLDIPLPYLTSSRLDEILQSRPGERILEIGPGTGLQTLHIAPKLSLSGRLDIVDIQQEMIDHVMRRAQLRGITTIVPNLSDARELPFTDGVFDAVYLVTALGEIPEADRVIAEAARVLKPGGRLVVGEFFDRHWIPLALGHGIPAVLVDSDQDALDRAFGTVAALLREASTLRALPAETLRATLATRTSAEQGGDATAVVEAVPESAVAKAKALSAICKVVPLGTPLLSGTSAIPIDEIAAWTGRPPDVIGTRFLSPPHLTKTVELVRARHTSDRTLQAATNLMHAFGRKTITVSDSPGFVVSRVVYPMINAAARLVGTGVATVEGVDALMRAWFLDSDGPLRTADRIGLDDLVHTL